MDTTNASPPGKESQVERLRSLLLEGALSPPTAPADDGYFDRLREWVRRRSAR